MNHYEKEFIIELWECDEEEFKNEIVKQYLTKQEILQNGRNSFGFGFNLPDSVDEVFKEIHESVTTFIYQNKEEIKQKICVDLMYCNKEADGEFEKEGWRVAIAIIDSLIVSATQAPIPIATLGVYIVKKQLLQKLCECQS